VACQQWPQISRNPKIGIRKINKKPTFMGIKFFSNKEILLTFS
jgi:hypothetical protein